jgi:hypothetical protein
MIYRMKNSVTILASKKLNYKNIIGIHNILLLFSFILIAQLSACQKKENKTEKKSSNREEFYWKAVACTPKGYPVTLISTNLLHSQGGKEYNEFSSQAGKYITDISNHDETDGSCWGGSGNVGRDGANPAPDRLNMIWYSPTENKIYKAKFDLPKKKIYDFFKEGYMFYKINNGKEDLHWETYDNLTVGLAPKGMVVLWICRYNQVEIGRYQAQELGKVEANKLFKEELAYLLINGNMPETISEEQLKNRKIPPKVIEEIKQGTISCKQWEDYRLRYNWKVEFNKPLKMYRYFIEYYNGEKQHYLPPRISQEVSNKKILEPSSKVVPNYIDMYVTAQNGRNYQLLLCPPDEQETIEAFKKLEEASPKATITVFITVDDDFKKFSVTLKNDKKEIVLEKALLRLFTLDKSNDLKNKK